MDVLTKHFTLTWENTICFLFQTEYSMLFLNYLFIIATNMTKVL